MERNIFGYLCRHEENIRFKAIYISAETKINRSNTPLIFFYTPNIILSMPLKKKIYFNDKFPKKTIKKI